MLGLLLTVILIAAALGIDMAARVTTAREMNIAADAAVSEALFKYVDNGATNFNDMKTGAQAALSKNTLTMEGFLESSRGTAAVNVDVSSGTPGNWGLITPGIWWDEVPPNGCAVAAVPVLPTPCPCSGGSPVVPCLQEIDPAAPAGAVANAAKIKVELPTGSYLNPIIAQSFGVGAQKFEAEATAKVNEWNIVIAVDVSRSSADETHPPYEKVKDYTAAEPTYPLMNSTPCAGWTNHAHPAGLTITTERFSLLKAMWSKTAPEFMHATRGGGAGVSNSGYYHDDYGCYTLDTRRVGGGGAVLRYYLVDKYVNPTTYYGPEPLTTYLHFINQLLVALGNYNGIVRIGFIAFDETALIEGSTNPDGTLQSGRRFDITPLDPAPAANNDVTDLQTITFNGTALASPGAQDIEARIQRYGLFIREGAHTNLPQAFREGIKMLRGHTRFASSKNSFILLSDGVSTCSEASGCSLTEAVVKEGIDESIDIVKDEFVPDGVEVSVILGGQGAHSLMVKSERNPNKCMDEEEARAHDPHYWMADESTGTSTFANHLAGTGTFYYSNKLNQAVTLSGGLWGPVFGCCSDGAGGCNATARASIDTACKNVAGAPSTTNKPTVPGTVSVGGETLTNGRLTCTPDFFSSRELVADYAQRIANQPAITLVE